MKKTLHVEGMMCAHCEARVKKTLESVPGVMSADVSHLAGTAEVTALPTVSDETLRKAVTDQGYDVTGIDGAE